MATKVKLKISIRVVFLVVLLLGAISCKNKTERKFYDTGELMQVREHISDSIMILTQYYKNGNLWCKAHFIKENDSAYIPSGHCVSYFSDGQLDWEGEYKQGYPVQLIIDTTLLKCINNAYLEVEKSPVLKGEVCNFRIVMPLVHSDLYLIMDSTFNKISKNPDIQSAYPYTVKPEREGKYIVRICFAANEEGHCDPGERTFSFAIDVQ
jgi:hypothetical protein